MDRYWSSNISELTNNQVWTILLEIGYNYQVVLYPPLTHFFKITQSLTSQKICDPYFKVFLHFTPHLFLGSPHSSASQKCCYHFNTETCCISPPGRWACMSTTPALCCMPFTLPLLHFCLFLAITNCCDIFYDCLTSDFQILIRWCYKQYIFGVKHKG